MCKAGGSKHKNENVPNSRKKKIKVEKPVEHNKWKCAAIGLTMTVLVAFSVKTYLGEKEQQPRMLHYVIREYIDIAHQQLHVENQLSTLLLGDPLRDIIINELRPIQERVASLRTQTSQYEKMQRIPGGPTSFMASSIKELDLIISNYMAALYSKVYTVLLEVSKAAIAITKTSAEMGELSSKRLDIDSIKAMVIENVTLIVTPMDPEMQRKIGELAEKTTWEETIEKLEKFASLYDGLEEITQQLSAKAHELFGVDDLRDLKNEDMTDDDYDQLVPFWDQLRAHRTFIEKEKRKLQTCFAVFAYFMHQSVQNLQDMLQKIQTFTEEQRFRYIKLQDMVLKDAQQLKVRIKNLQYQYAKHRSEL